MRTYRAQNNSNKCKTCDKTLAHHRYDPLSTEYYCPEADTPAKQSVIVYGPQGCGKTHHSKRIANYLGLSRLMELDDMKESPRAVLKERKHLHHDTLFLTNNVDYMMLLSGGEFGITAIPFDEIAAKIGLPTTGRKIDPDKEREAAKAAEACGLASQTNNPYTQLAKDYEGVSFPPVVKATPISLSAPDILKRAAQHMEDRAAARDQPGGERSMKRTVDAFNALTGHALTERDGWMFMAVLKAARACTTPTGLADDYEDGAAYFGLAGEAAQR